MLNAYPQRSSEPEVVCHHVRLLGTGAANPTKQLGAGIAATRTSEGLYKLTWSDNPGTFVGVSHCFGAATPADLVGHTCVRDTFDTSAYSLEVRVADDADAADDLEADEYLDLQVYFKRTAVSA